MDGTQLRIGNWVEIDGKPEQVFTGRGIDNCGSFRPIVLTEQWALNLGFTKPPHITVRNPTFSLDISRGRFILINGIGTGSELVTLRHSENGKVTDLCLHSCFYDGQLTVHKLQNIVSVIAGEELKFTEPDQEASFMKSYDLWSEGYCITGGSSKAIFHGKFNGKTFKDAILSFKKSLTDEYSIKCVDVEGMKYWGCSFFDNEADARKSFG